ncbi:hypothetical protein AMAG_08300 [Allomyces macrogynus ATCC 38327]|uniref:Uncharacterized protein n=1 Tax=Allomyces macrogynus (strain ATCC 38327) TaxID=578462 RepID=A0A0L0SL25_ALLM3|nr:hypothetical protein AMAG_08300 [Allomyces macrogynus ATCC 38327]|eukprot:KNE63138.1 hypothetical protein AMAG_08300 [Allomyces macrogynus ATCC 38327]
MAAAESKRAQKIHNQVHNDAIWRQMITNEYACAANWPKNWAFMKDSPYPHGTSSSATSKPPTSADGSGGLKLPDLSSSSSSSRRPTGLGSASLYPVRTHIGAADGAAGDIVTYNVKHLVRRVLPEAKYSFPATSATVYGWNWHVNATPVDGAAMAPLDRPADGNEKVPRRAPPVLDRFARVAPGRVDTLKWWGGARESLP